MCTRHESPKGKCGSRCWAESCESSASAGSIPRIAFFSFSVWPRSSGTVRRTLRNWWSTSMRSTVRQCRWRFRRQSQEEMRFIRHREVCRLISTVVTRCQSTQIIARKAKISTLSGMKYTCSSSAKMEDAKTSTDARGAALGRRVCPPKRKSTSCSSGDTGSLDSEILRCMPHVWSVFS